MAKRKGFAPVPNELLEALCAQLAGAELKVAIWGIRETLGWKSRRTTCQAKISLSRFSTKTGLSKQGVKNALKKLEKRKIFESILKGSGKRSTLWYFNDNPESWVPLESTPECTPEAKKRGQPECTPEAKKGAQKPVGNTKKGPGGNPSSPQGESGSHSRGGLESSGVAPINRSLKKSSQRESAIALASLIEKTFQTFLQDPDFKLNDGEVGIIKGVGNRYSTSTPEALSASFRNFLGIQEKMDRQTIVLWAECAGATLVQPHDSKGRMKRMRLPGG